MSKEITPFCMTIWIQDNQNCFSLCVLRGSFCADITIPRFQNLCGAVYYGPATKCLTPAGLVTFPHSVICLHLSFETISFNSICKSDPK